MISRFMAVSLVRIARSLDERPTARIKYASYVGRALGFSRRIASVTTEVSKLRGKKPAGATRSARVITRHEKPDFCRFKRLH
jgi:hypothetical protein